MAHNLLKYEKAEDRLRDLMASSMTEIEALAYMRDNVELYQLLPNVDTPHNRKLMNTQLNNAKWFAANIIPTTVSLTTTPPWAEMYKATGGEEIVRIPSFRRYNVGSGELLVTIEGVEQYVGIDFAEESEIDVKFFKKLMTGEHVMFRKV